MTNLKKGILLLVTSSLFFSLMNLFVNLSGDLPVTEKSFFRNLVAIVFATIVIKQRKIEFKIKKQDTKNLIIRSTAGTIGILCNFYAIDHLLLSDAASLSKMSPFFAIIFSYFILKENVTLKQIVIVTIAFFGCLFVVQPTFNSDIFPSLIAILGAFVAGLAYTEIRVLGLSGVKGPVIVLFFSLFSCLAVLPFVVTNYVPLTSSQAIYLLLAGLSASVAQFSITKAYYYASAKDISIYDYSQIIFVGIIGYFVLNQIPNAYSFIGYTIIISMAYLMFRYNKNQRKILEKNKA